MEKLKIFLNCGMDGKKTFIITGRSLEALLFQNPIGLEVPYVVTRICDSIRSKGFDHEWFSENVDDVELPKLQKEFTYGLDFERTKITNTEELLVVFLEKMADPVIPYEVTRRFIEIYEVYKNYNTSTYLYELRHVINNFLPQSNYNLFKYLVNFMVEVCTEGFKNKEADLAAALGPSLFRCSARLYHVVAEITSDIMKYHTVVLEQGNPITKVPWFHGGISKKETNRLLKKNGDFLIREKKCHTNGTRYILSVRWTWNKHFKIQYEKGGWRIKNRFMCFQTIPELVNYYCNTVGSVGKNICKAVLKRAIPRNNELVAGLCEQAEASSAKDSSSGLALDVAHQYTCSSSTGSQSQIH